MLVGAAAKWEIAVPKKWEKPIYKVGPLPVMSRVTMTPGKPIYFRPVS